MLPRGRLDQPQDGARRPWTCRSRIRRPGRASRPADREADAVDRIDVADRAAQQALLDREMLLEVGDLEHQRLRGRQAWPAPSSSLGMPARGPMARPLLLVGRRTRARQRSSANGAARREGAARRQIGQRRHDAGDFLQPRVGLAGRRRASGRAAGSRPAGRACRDAAAARTARRPSPPRPSCRHTSRSRAARSRPPRRDRA